MIRVINPNTEIRRSVNPKLIKYNLCIFCVEFLYNDNNAASPKEWNAIDNDRMINRIIEIMNFVIMSLFFHIPFQFMFAFTN